MTKTLSNKIAEELSIKPEQVEATIALLDDGATIPFIARYRKEKTQGLDDTQLRHLDERLTYLRELDKRRDSILNSIQEQGKLTDSLKLRFDRAETKTELEDLYLPYKPKRKTKAQTAREAGLQPLADTLLADPTQNPEILAQQYINPDKQIADTKAALEGARQILMEQFSEQAELLQILRNMLWQRGVLSSHVVKSKAAEAEKFRDYFDYEEAIKQVPSHRALAIFRGRNEGFLSISLDLPVQENTQRHPGEEYIAQQFQIQDQQRPADSWLADTVRWAWKVKIHPKLDIELKMRLKDQAEEEAIRVFSANLKDLLLAAPAGYQTTMGLDPGLRTGVKVTLVDATGKLLDFTTIFPHAPRNQWDESIEILNRLIKKHHVSLISIGNGTASRETDQLVRELKKRYPHPLNAVITSEAGASVYSASALAAQEFPDLDVSFRGAVSIARRLQDPLAELVKIEPKAIGVGQYQHDVNQGKLARSLDAVVEDCVNAVGVDVNTASSALLTHVAGLNKTTADNIVNYRNEQGVFNKRSDLKKVPRLGPKAFEQAAGFLRIPNGKDPLDASAVHPEAAVIVKTIATKNNKSIKTLIGDQSFLNTLNPQDYTNETFGVPTVIDIIKELEKPGRDPRPEFITATFQDGINDIKDLEPDMVLEGVISNVTNFGAFVDIGVHQDGLVHISKLSDRFISDPREVVKAGDIVKVTVEEVDIKRKRISLSMRQKHDTTLKEPIKHRKPKPKANAKNDQHDMNTSMAAAFAKAKR